MKNLMDRRRFIKSIMATSAILPLSIKALVPNAQAASNVAPKRAIFFYVPDGIARDHWHVTNDNGSLVMNTMSAPLDSIKDDLIFYEGLNMYTGAGHESIDTCLRGSMNDSLDVFLAKQWAGQTDINREFLGAAATYQNGSGYFSWSNGAPMVPDNDPVNAFRRIFNIVPTGVGTDRTKAIVDVYLEELNYLKQQLGYVEKEKLDNHFDAINDMHKRLNASAASCSPAPDFINTSSWPGPTLGANGYNSHNNFAAIVKQQIDVTVKALECDRTRVMSLQLSHPVCEREASHWMGDQYSNNYHYYSHQSNTSSQQKFIECRKWYMEQFAYLVEQLKNTPDVDGGSLLNNTIVYMFSELGDGANHDARSMPIVTAGQAGGQLQTGRALKFNGESHTKLFVSMCDLLVPEAGITSYGYTGKGEGGLTGLF
jgi:hypothetical protein